MSEMFLHSPLANTQFSFRPHTSMHEVLLWMYDDLMENPPKDQARCILALGLKGSFDNVTHASILECLKGVHCGKTIYDYMKSFLTGRQATLTLGNMTSQLITLGPWGAPQGAMLSPLLFNLAMWDLPAKLNEIPGIERAIYVDDVTI